MAVGGESGWGTGERFIGIPNCQVALQNDTFYDHYDMLASAFQPKRERGDPEMRGQTL